MNADIPRPTPRSQDVGQYIQAMPQYRESLNLLQRILDFQAALAEKLALRAHKEKAQIGTAEEGESGLRIERSKAYAKWRDGQPLLAGESLSIPPTLFREALVELSNWLTPGEPAQIALDRMLDSKLMAPPNIQATLTDLISDSEACLRRLGDAVASEPAILAYLVRAALVPFFEKQAAPYRRWVETAAWRHGMCPMCGSEPWMARLARDDGRRVLACSLCHTEWNFDRLRCPFCERDDQPQLRHFTLDGDEAHRVDCCDRCQRYIKTVDERVSGRPANLTVEDVITSHLDILAREQGYQ